MIFSDKLFLSPSLFFFISAYHNHRRHQRSISEKKLIFYFLIISSFFFQIKAYGHSDQFKPLGLPIERLIVNHRDPAIRQLVEQEAKINLPPTYQASIYNNFIKTLVQKYKFANVTLELEPTVPSGKVLLTLTIFDKEIIQSIAFAGNLLLSEEIIKNKIGLTSGAVLNEVSLALTREKILRLYREIGYFNAEVEFKVTSDDSNPSSKKLTIRIEEGQLSQIKKVFLLGFGSHQETKIRRIIGLRPGEPLSISALKDRIFQLKNYLKEKQYYQAKMLNPVFELLPSPGGINIYLAAHLGKKMSIKFTGDLGFDRLILQSAMVPESFPDDVKDLQKEIQNNLRSFYEREGYFKPTIHIHIGVDSDELSIQVKVDKNELAELVIEEISGTKQFSKAQVLQMISGGQSNQLEFRPYREKNGAALCEEIKNQLQSRGYASPQCQIVNNHFNLATNQGLVSLNINEGQLLTIQKIEIAGNSHLAENEIRSALGFASGGIFSQQEVDQGTKIIISLCQREGYIDCTVTASSDRDSVSGKTNITYTLSEGELAVVGNIDILGNQKTSDYLIRRKVKLETGAPLTSAKLQQLKKDIEGLGLFRRVSIIDKGKQEGSERHDIVISVEETKSIHAEVGGGFGSLYDEDAVFFKDNVVRTFGLIRHNNFFGGGESVYLRGGLKRRLTNADLTERSLAVGYREPDILSSQVNGNVELKTSLEDEIAFDSDQKQLTLKLDRSFDLGISAALKYTFEIARTFNFEASLDSTEAFEENFVLGSLGPIISWDRRNDKFTPTKGTFTSISSELFDRYLLSEENFLKSSIREDLFFEIFKSFILNVSVRGGAMQKLSIDQTIPRDKRFFLGAAGSLRGFREDYVGTASTFINGSPIGGTIFVNYLSEIMIPVFAKFYVALFSDGGNVYADSEDFSLSDLRHSAGAGIRYITPVGPVKLDYGIILDRQAGENFGSIHFSLGVF